MTNGTNNYPTMCRWTGRILGGLLIFLIVSIAAGQGVPNPYGEPSEGPVWIFGVGFDFWRHCCGVEMGAFGRYCLAFGMGIVCSCGRNFVARAE